MAGDHRDRTRIRIDLFERGNVMKHNRHKLSKGQFFKFLADKGITVKRVTTPEGIRVWETSDGKWIKNLRELPAIYKDKKS